MVVDVGDDKQTPSNNTLHQPGFLRGPSRYAQMTLERQGSPKDTTYVHPSRSEGTDPLPSIGAFDFY